MITLNALVLSAIGFTLSPSEFRVHSKAQGNNGLIIHDATNCALYYDANGVGSVAQVQFAQFDPAIRLTSSDLELG
ncbi:hypothetical protein [Phaeobacter sp. NW0010-22]|uniref:hypothetical protein n=1 Tax=Phaeobacter sp. NW0010-22 TaxID=3135907 RepID=UPI00310286E4